MQVKRECLQWCERTKPLFVQTLVSTSWVLFLSWGRRRRSSVSVVLQLELMFNTQVSPRITQQEEAWLTCYLKTRHPLEAECSHGSYIKKRFCTMHLLPMIDSTYHTYFQNFRNRFPVLTHLSLPKQAGWVIAMRSTWSSDSIGQSKISEGLLVCLSRCVRWQSWTTITCLPLFTLFLTVANHELCWGWLRLFRQGLPGAHDGDGIPALDACAALGKAQTP